VQLLHELLNVLVQIANKMGFKKIVVIAPLLLRTNVLLVTMDEINKPL
jgi:hypothetical protein